MTHSGGKPHNVGYRGQAHKLTCHDSGRGQRIIIGWSDTPFEDHALRAVETRPSWTDARSEPVTNRETGD